MKNIQTFMLLVVKSLFFHIYVKMVAPNKNLRRVLS